MTLNIDRDYIVSLWRLGERQLLTSQDQTNIEHALPIIYEALTQPQEPEAKKIGRPRGGKNKQPEPLFPPGSTYSGEDEMPVIQGEFK